MKVEYSRTADALYIHFREVEIDMRSQDIEVVVLDFDGTREIVGIEMPDAGSGLSPQEVVNAGIENLPVGLLEQSLSVGLARLQPQSLADHLQKLAEIPTLGR